MRLQIFSDLHLEEAVSPPIAATGDVDAVVVAGDTCEGAERAFTRLREIVPMQIPIIAVLGEREYHGSDIASEQDAARRLAPLFGIHLLENDTAVIGGVRFAGATLWTDYRLFGSANMGPAMRAAAERLRDHQLIAWSQDPRQSFRPRHAFLLHSRSRRFLAETLNSPHAGPTVVVTHHAPHPGSLQPRFANDLLSAASVSDLADLIAAAGPDLWVHGHVHASFDYRVGGTRILCNPHGNGSENPDFDPTLVVEVGA